jgi:serine-type D-Ala-D-Ala carboxypeptidase/endopeptidase
MLGYSIYRELSLGIILSTLIMISFFTFSNDIQNQFQLAHSQQRNSITNNSNYSSKSEISNALLEQFKEIAFKQLLSNSSNTIAMSNSGSPVPIVVGIVTTNGTQVSGNGNISSSNNTVDGNTVFDIASIAKTFVTII